MKHGELVRKAMVYLPQDVKEHIYDLRDKWFDVFRDMPLEEFIGLYTTVVVDGILYAADRNNLFYLKEEDFIRHANGEYRIKLVQCTDCLIRDGVVIKNRYGHYDRLQEN